jgi:hypothetical protein
MPIGESDPWLSLVLNEGTRDRSILVYEHQTIFGTGGVLTDVDGNPLEFVGGDDIDLVGGTQSSDAELIFSGIMDEAEITDELTVKVIESSHSKNFPPDSIDQPTFTHLLKPGDTIPWGSDVITVN